MDLNLKIIDYKLLELLEIKIQFQLEKYFLVVKFNSKNINNCCIFVLNKNRNATY